MHLRVLLCDKRISKLVNVPGVRPTAPRTQTIQTVAPMMLQERRPVPTRSSMITTRIHFKVDRIDTLSIPAEARRVNRLVTKKARIGETPRSCESCEQGKKMRAGADEAAPLRLRLIAARSDTDGCCFHACACSRADTRGETALVATGPPQAYQERANWTEIGLITRWRPRPRACINDRGGPCFGMEPQVAAGNIFRIATIRQSSRPLLRVIAVHISRSLPPAWPLWV